MKFIDDIKNVLGDTTLDKSGAAFYSSINTLTKGQYLIIGLNPGGDPLKIKSTIRDSFQTILQPGYNAYYEKWLPNGRKHRLQENLKDLFNFLGKDLRNVCATNLIYERTQKESDLTFKMLPKYRKILYATLKEIEPEDIICFGRKTIFELKHYFKEWEQKCIVIPSGHGNWTIEFIEIFAPNKVYKIVGLPHLSIYSLYSRNEIKQQIKDFVVCT